MRALVLAFLVLGACGPVAAHCPVVAATQCVTGIAQVCGPDHRWQDVTDCWRVTTLGGGAPFSCCAVTTDGGAGHACLPACPGE